MNSKIGILGGSFNPVHNGHIALVKQCIKSLNLDTALLVPTFITPLKSNIGFVSAEHRYNMCLIATEKYDNIQVSDIEILRKGKSYTSETLSEIKRINNNSELFFILGADAYLSIDKWYNPKKIFESATLVTTARDYDDFNSIAAQNEYLTEKGAKTIFIDKKIDMISSTKVREAICLNQDVSDMLDQNVFKYIKRNMLYGA